MQNLHNLLLQNGIAIGKELSRLEDWTKEKYPNQILDAYLAFEALTQHSYDFECVMCGQFPTILTIDGNRKAAFDMTSMK